MNIFERRRMMKHLIFGMAMMMGLGFLNPKPSTLNPQHQRFGVGVNPSQQEQEQIEKLLKDLDTPGNASEVVAKPMLSSLKKHLRISAEVPLKVLCPLV